MGIRTSNLLIRSQMLYPVELRAQLTDLRWLFHGFFHGLRYADQTVKKNGTWTRTRLKNLLRHKSGRYYARAFVGGKEVWQRLGTSYFSVAEVNMAKFLEKHRSVRRRGATIASAK